MLLWATTLPAPTVVDTLQILLSWLGTDEASLVAILALLATLVTVRAARRPPAARPQDLSPPG